MGLVLQPENVLIISDYLVLWGKWNGQIKMLRFVESVSFNDSSTACEWIPANWVKKLVFENPVNRDNPQVKSNQSGLPSLPFQVHLSLGARTFLSNSMVKTAISKSVRSGRSRSDRTKPGRTFCVHSSLTRTCRLWKLKEIFRARSPRSCIMDGYHLQIFADDFRSDGTVQPAILSKGVKLIVYGPKDMTTLLISTHAISWELDLCNERGFRTELIANHTNLFNPRS